MEKKKELKYIRHNISAVNILVMVIEMLTLARRWRYCTVRHLSDVLTIMLKETGTILRW